MSIHFITGSDSKYNEAREIIPELQRMELDLQEIQSIDAKEVIKNKLEEAKKHLNGGLVVEDVSLYFECLNGLPGPLIKWFMKTVGNEGLVKIATAFGSNRAEAKAIVGYYQPSGSVEYFEGVVGGKIVSPRGENGFGWDPIFQPDNSGKTFGEMNADEKNALSMRKMAFQKLKEFINK